MKNGFGDEVEWELPVGDHWGCCFNSFDRVAESFN